MLNTLLIIEVVLAAIMIFLILIQAGDAGISGIWSGGGETYHTKRGVEKVIFVATIITSVLFAVTALITLTIV
ncbi:preprotein translocase subunit SecG [Microgenomates group bacterium]|nr:preprotein translocase subunit SecG [Microgenomates group bacterium]